MSETEHNKGKLFPIHRGDDIEGSAKAICEANGYDREEGDTFLKTLEDDGYRRFHIVGDVIYSVIYESCNGDVDIFNSSIDEGGVITFETRYYNGGCSFDEALGYALDNPS